MLATPQRRTKVPDAPTAEPPVDTTEDDRMDRAQLQSAIAGVDFPASRDDLLEKARENGADDEVLAVLRELPALTFASTTEVTSQLSATS